MTYKCLSNYNLGLRSEDPTHTDEYALMGNGRQTPWVYYDPIQKRYFKTTGQTPKRPLYHAYQQNKSLIQNRANEVLR